MIRLEGVSIQRGDFELSELNLFVPPQEYAVLMGPTGCGKTTVVETICGLQRTGSGSIFLDGVDVTNLPAAQREIGYVPQDHALFPTMRVDKQIEFGLIVRKVSKASRNRRLKELAELMGIGQLMKRFPHGLSGGERQRVALARALSFRPRIVCLDEPLSALDDSNRHSLADLLRAIQEQEKVTVLHITHNNDDALRLGTTKFLFNGNQIKPVD